MGILETFSKRQKRFERAGKQDVYRYDELPEPFRVQVIHIWRSALGVFYTSSGYASPTNKYWTLIHDGIAREHGVFVLGDGHSHLKAQCEQYVLSADTMGALDIIEYSFHVIDRGIRGVQGYDLHGANVSQDPDGAIKELNARFIEHGIGYQYMGGIVVRLDSQFTHSEIVQPALSLLSQAGFDGPADEFIRAFEHYRHRRIKEAISEALKAF
jgi:hypothetical protein